MPTCLRRALSMLLVLPWAASSWAAPALYHDVVASNGPILWYSFAEASGDVINRGSLGATFNGVVSGAVAREVPTVGGDTALSFQSNEAFIESGAASPLSGNPSFSIEAILYLSGSAGNWGPVLHWGDGGGDNNAPQRWGAEVYFSAQGANNDRLFAGFYNAGVRTANVVPTGQWIHVVWVRRGGLDSEAGSTFYVNGDEVAVVRDTDLTAGFPAPGFASSSEINVLPSPFRIHRGRDYPWPGDPNQSNRRYFGGALDELALYGFALTPDRVRELYTALSDGNVPPGGYGDSSGAHELVIEVTQ